MNPEDIQDDIIKLEATGLSFHGDSILPAPSTPTPPAEGGGKFAVCKHGHFASHCETCAEIAGYKLAVKGLKSENHGLRLDKDAEIAGLKSERDRYKSAYETLDRCGLGPKVDALKFALDTANKNLSEERQHHMKTVIERETAQRERDEARAGLRPDEWVESCTKIEKQFLDMENHTIELTNTISDLRTAVESKDKALSNLLTAINKIVGISNPNLVLSILEYARKEARAALTPTKGNE